MKSTSIAELKKHLSAYIAMAEDGESIEVRKRNVPVAHLVGIPGKQANRTKLGCARGTVVVHADLTEPMIPREHWSMLGDVEP